MSELIFTESGDGTEIAFEKHGSGPPLVLVHGTNQHRGYWDEIRPLLNNAATLIAPDRRGRGDSGDTDDYHFEKEVDDLCAVIESIEEKPILFGHSFGGLCALETAQRIPVKGLILYEPTLMTGVHRDAPSLATQMDTLLEADKQRRAVERFREVALGDENPHAESIQPSSIDIVASIARESHVVEQYQLENTLELSLPVLLLVSENGPKNLRDGIEALHERLADSQLIELTGVGHGGASSAPRQVASEVRSFIDSIR